jgi:hypothetical protein
VSTRTPFQHPLRSDAKLQNAKTKDKIRLQWHQMILVGSASRVDSNQIAPIPIRRVRDSAEGAK